MSGGRPSRPQTAEGDRPSCTNEVRKEGETAGCARSASAGLGLDGGWGRRPLFEKEKVQPFRAGIEYRARDGSRMAETANGWLGSRQPGP
jgi:hypothetical protein